MSNLCVGDRWQPLIDSTAKEVSGYIELTLTDGTIVNGMTAEDIATCSITDPQETEITVGGVTFRKDQVKKIRFGKDFDLTSLDRFGYNFTNLVEIDPIPEGITGDYCLRDFLRGCEKFNQLITIPEGIDGRYCLESFLAYCRSFNQPITIPEGIKGVGGISWFLCGCTSFNQPIIIPEGITGYNCLKSFLYGCTSFNQPITIPEGVEGDCSLDSFLSGCTSFNQPITIPNGINKYQYIGSFLRDCDNMISPITINDISKLAYYDNGVLSTSTKTAPMYTQGIPIIGLAANDFKSRFPNNDNDYYCRKLI